MSLNNQVKIENTMPSIVTTLPTGADRYLGREVYYKPAGAANSPVWHCVWDTALNGGSGAWAVVGGVPLYARQSASGSSSSASWVGLPNGPTITIPVGGLYIIRTEGQLVNLAATRATVYDCKVGLNKNGGLIQDFVGQANIEVQYGLIRTGMTINALSLATNDLLSLVFASLASNSWDIGTGALWFIQAMPVELRP